MDGTIRVNLGFKASKTLSGIETRYIGKFDSDEHKSGFKASKTLSGIETWGR